MTTDHWVEAAPLAAVRRRKRLAVTVADRDIALFLVGDTVYALDDVCVHKQRRLSGGTLLYGRVICPGHQWKIDPATGEIDDRAECQPTYAVRVDDGVVYVDPRPRVRAAAMEEPS
ncbi:Rieske 2Fe-2S domain-containing protein [Actinomadura sp. WMMB 499]|uniref:Rieske (2Fe-2S) protein n=1 Tax=Actinomadura sp. WMMB 499 TaxID=1219491 RepID=UPI001248CAD6|nr:Rieske 2Fe-2S domain-containing protein [Actinomadura sp. WMMB 499]QFG25026.1 Rieske 2Fe-2S domain-containing protein [Actinomadura sp. WMMB 499]